MKSQFAFAQLKKECLPMGNDEAAIFFAMQKVQQVSTHVTPLGTFSEIERLLAADRYYVANVLVAYKGKVPIYNGKVFIADRSSLVSFLKQAIADSDLRPLLISPACGTSPEQVIYMSEDECHVYRIDSALT